MFDVWLDSHASLPNFWVLLHLINEHFKESRPRKTTWKGGNKSLTCKNNGSEEEIIRTNFVPF